jgi:hypothetical protein
MDQYADKAGGALPDHDCDEVAQLQSAAADCGIVVRTIESDEGVTIWASRWGLSRSFPTPDALRSWLRDFGIEVQA